MIVFVSCGGRNVGLQVSLAVSAVELSAQAGVILQDVVAQLISGGALAEVIAMGARTFSSAHVSSFISRYVV